MDEALKKNLEIKEEKIKNLETRLGVQFWRLHVLFILRGILDLAKESWSWLL